MNVRILRKISAKSNRKVRHELNPFSNKAHKVQVFICLKTAELHFNFYFALNYFERNILDKRRRKRQIKRDIKNFK